ncbi:MAG TPA: sensor histidine kinase [Actinomycetota bacterium]|nr:sensor histidine kinase [Actinomycetota bacterium]
MRASHATGWPAHGWPGRPRGGGSPAWLSVKVGVPQVLFTSFAAHNNTGRRDLDALAFALLVLGPVALAWRRRWPVPVLAVNLAATEAYYLLGYEWGPAFLSLAVAFWTILTAGRRLSAWIVAAVGYVSYFGLAFLVGWGPPPTVAQAVGVAAWLLLVLVAAEVGRARREQVAEAVRTRQEEARRRASEERLRIARELHDVVAHSISLINVQASTALHLIDERPGQARTALTAIKRASKEALGELRSVVDILRQSDEEPPPRTPAAGLARLDDLVSRVRAAGLEVLTKVEGDQRPLPAPVDLAAFRIVQEALTNVHRHAGAATATVHVTYGERDLTVQVDDDGRGASSGGTSGGGAGIPGMRERVATLGGELEAGPRGGGGFRVLARLPLDGGG